jgi:hypothetical protein
MTVSRVDDGRAVEMWTNFVEDAAVHQLTRFQTSVSVPKSERTLFHRSLRAAVVAPRRGQAPRRL